MCTAEECAAEICTACASNKAQHMQTCYSSFRENNAESENIHGVILGVKRDRKIPVSITASWLSTLGWLSLVSLSICLSAAVVPAEQVP